MKKFYIVIIDSGWPSVAHVVLQAAMGLLREYLGDQNLIIFPKEDSRDFLKNHPEDIGTDPIIIITDINPKEVPLVTEEEINGIRINLGKVKDRDEVINYLQNLCQLVRHAGFITAITWEEKKKIARMFLKDVMGNVLLKFLELIV